ncbi:MAG: hypothetical protein WBW34_02865 [Nitrososphaeraceae archaeon]
MRQSIRKEAFRESQQFLDAIGTAEMEQEILRSVLSFSRNAKHQMEDETGISTSLDEDDVKRYLDEVLIELRGKSKK